ncbi:MAG: hypothetical protein HY653_01120 [Acidobacteria bacterium]|nr:hypothetical protein [Acidobacteriota bacterium]
MKYVTSARGWSVELFLMFSFGFALASIIWLGLWFFQIRPAHAATLKARETALVECTTAKDQCNELKDKIQAEKEEIDLKLDEALRGWGRCIRGEGRS